MLKVAVEDLTQNQQYGVAYAVKKANAPLITENENITKENEAITARNAGKPEAEQEALKELKTLYTHETYLAFVLETAIDSWYDMLYKEREEMFKNAMKNLPEEQIEALAAQFGVGSVLWSFI